MKKIILFAAAAAMLLVGCQNLKTYAVIGEVEGLEGYTHLLFILFTTYALSE